MNNPVGQDPNKNYGDNFEKKSSIACLWRSWDL
jgi:hypothetical protein